MPKKKNIIYKFDHTLKRLTKILGIVGDRWDDMSDVSEEIMDKDLDKRSDEIEEMLNKSQPQTDMEFFIAGYMLGGSSAMRMMKKAMEEVLEDAKKQGKFQELQLDGKSKEEILEQLSKDKKKLKRQKIVN